jgi:hypothetical protein
VDAGCTADSLAATASQTAPSDTLPPLPSTSATPSPTEDPPGATGYPLPEDARAYTPEGARAFFDYFIAVLNASRPLHDPVPIREITQGCEYCDELSARYEQAGVDGITIIGGELVLNGVGAVTMRPLESGAIGASMSFRVIQRAGQVLDAAGNLVSDTPELQADGTIEPAWLADQRDWLVSLYSVDPQ